MATRTISDPLLANNESLSDQDSQTVVQRKNVEDCTSFFASVGFFKFDPFLAANSFRLEQIVTDARGREQELLHSNLPLNITLDLKHDRSLLELTNQCRSAKMNIPVCSSRTAGTIFGKERELGFVAPVRFENDEVHNVGVANSRPRNCGITSLWLSLPNINQGRFLLLKLISADVHKDKWIYFCCFEPELIWLLQRNSGPKGFLVPYPGNKEPSGVYEEKLTTSDYFWITWTTEFARLIVVSHKPEAVLRQKSLHYFKIFIQP
ncbi:hypothetical protein C8J56DRAFT_888245 [Mycena floridula]|nr:hypothetical protein C8J56DRAFT_888245 [Mycena floridula]